MTEKELQERLKTALDHAAPDDLAAVLSRCGTGNGTVIDMNKGMVNTKKNRAWKRSLIAACLALALLGGGGGVFYQRAYAVASVVSLDVNPSIELRVNRSEKVLSCVGLNAEAASVLADMNGGKDLKGAKLDVAVNAIVGALVRSGYLDKLDSAILISVEDKDTARGARLQQELVASVDGVLQTAENTASVLSQNVAADAGLDSRAQQNNISTGRAHLIDQVMALNGDLAFDQLAALSVEELSDLLQTGAPGMPVGQEAALRAVLDYAGLAEADYTACEVDPELDERTPCYEVELFVDGREWDYAVDAYTGEVIQGAAAPAANAPSDPGGDIGEDAAIAAALDHAGLAEDQVSRLKCERDRDDGRIEYEIEFRYDGCEYEYTVDAASGAILDHERDFDD